MTRNKNIFYTFLFAAAASCIFTASTLLGISLFTEDEYVGIVIGVALMLVALLFHNLAKLFRAIPRSSTAPCFISYLLNTVGCGFVASSYYTAVKSQAELGELFAAALPAILLVLLCTCVFIFTKKYFATVLVTFCVLDAALAAFAVYGWITDDSPFFSFLLFSCVFSIFYVIALYDIARNEEKARRRSALMRKISFHSFGIFIVITVIVLFVLSLLDGDGFDLSDLGDIGDVGDGKKKKSKSAKGKAAVASAAALEVLDAGQHVIGDAVDAHREKNKKNKEQ